MEYRPYGQPERPIVSEGGPDPEGQRPPHGDFFAEGRAAPAVVSAQEPARDAQGNAPKSPTFAQLIGAAPRGEPTAGEAAQKPDPFSEPWREEPAHSLLPPSAQNAGMPAMPDCEAQAGVLAPGLELVPAGAYQAALPMGAYLFGGYGDAPPVGMGRGLPENPRDFEMPGYAPDARGYAPDAPYALDSQTCVTDPQGCAADAQIFAPDMQGYPSPDAQALRQTHYEGAAFRPWRVFDASPPPFGDAACVYDVPTGYDAGTGYDVPTGYDAGSGYDVPTGYDAGSGYDAASAYDIPPAYDAPYDASPSAYGEAHRPFGAARASFDPASIPMEAFGRSGREGYSEFWQPQDPRGYWQQPEWQPSDWNQESEPSYWNPSAAMPDEGRKLRIFQRRRGKGAMEVPSADAPSALARLARRRFGTPKAALGSLMDFAYYSLVILILASAIRFALDEDPHKMLLGVRPYTVLTNSMRSTGPESFSAGDVILVRDVDPAQVQVGDIITYQPGSDTSVYLTHRVTQKLTSYKGVEGDWFVTKGDANNAEDLPVRGSTIVGKKLLVIPKLGHAMKYIYDHIALVGLMGAAALGLFIVLRIYFSSVRRMAAM